MKISFSQPPNYDKIVQAFDIKGKPVIFAYGDTIYNPHRGHIPDDLYIHEAEHSRQQGDDPAGWWDRYIADPAFRLTQELEAYQLQFQHFKEKTADRNEYTLFAKRLARDLSSPIYGSIISKEEAYQKITQ